MAATRQELERAAVFVRDLIRRDESNRVYAPILARLRREIEAVRELDDLLDWNPSSDMAA